mmetsp:Transcript_4073/g.3837  ORF Transcript_4073/g.3837 Transcript_4073/m.3837 type:complete len:82 (-) Transcript_4073:85-330(-)
MKPWNKGADTPETIPIEFNYYKDEKWDKVINLDDNDCWGKAALQTIDNWVNVPTNGDWTKETVHFMDGHRKTTVWYISASD